MKFHGLEFIYLHKEMGILDRPMYGLCKKEEAEKVFAYNEEGYYECGNEKLLYNPDMQDDVSLGWQYMFAGSDDWLIFDFDEDTFFYAEGDGEAEDTEECWFLNDIEGELDEVI